MGMSGAKGKVYYIEDSCPPVAWTVPSGSAVAYTDDVTKFDLEDSVMVEEYGHDKSGGWQDACAGTRRVQVNLEAKVAPANADGAGGVSAISAGKVLYLQLYPFGATGTCAATPVAGYALIKQVSYTYDQQTGKAIGYTATVVSRGPWTGLDDGSAWGGFECDCAA